MKNMYSLISFRMQNYFVIQVFCLSLQPYEKKKDEIYLGDGWPVGAVARQL